MKISIIILSLLFSTVDEPITFSDLLFALENDLNSVSDKFNSIGFIFLQTDSNEVGGDAVVWRYVADEKLNLLVAKFCLKPNCGGIQVQTDNEKLYFDLKKEAIALGFEYADSNIDNSEKIDEVYSYYYKDNLKLQMSVGMYKNGKDNLYSILLSTSE
jgi:hypothetical protein